VNRLRQRVPLGTNRTGKSGFSIVSRAWQ
jgi:hypothetical protein